MFNLLPLGDITALVDAVSISSLPPEKRAASAHWSDHPGDGVRAGPIDAKQRRKCTSRALLNVPL